MLPPSVICRCLVESAVARLVGAVESVAADEADRAVGFVVLAAVSRDQ